MVDLGQKRWKRFHLFYWNKVKQKENRGITNRLRVYLFFYLNQLCKRQKRLGIKKIDKSTFQSICLFYMFFNLCFYEKLFLRSISSRNFRPINCVEKSFNIIRSSVLVMQIISMFPNIHTQNRSTTTTDSRH
jgi:hypothetical protein